MDEDRIWQMKRHQIEDREKLLLQELDGMGHDEMRWTVRLLADCLSGEQRQELLAGYHEDLRADAMQDFLRRFIPRYAQVALLDLTAKAARGGTGLEGLTEEDLQNIPAIEKWELTQSAPRSLTPIQVCRELARLVMCLQYDLLFDPELGKAAIEFPLYFRLQEALGRLATPDLYDLADRIANQVNELRRQPHGVAAQRLVQVREEIVRASKIQGSLEELLGRPMERLPREYFQPSEPGLAPGKPSPERAMPKGLSALSRDELRLNLQVWSDLLSLAETEEVLGPYRARYPSIGQMPDDDLRRLVADIMPRVENRTPCDFIQRHRTGRLLATPGFHPQVWEMLPRMRRLELLEGDDAALDVAQATRHLAKIFLSHSYETLVDAEAQASLVAWPLYSALIHRLIQELARPGDAAKLMDLHRAVTHMVLNMEEAPRPQRPQHLSKIRQTIGASLDISDQTIRTLDESLARGQGEEYR